MPMDYRDSSKAALAKKLGSSTRSTSIYDGVFSSYDPVRSSSLSSRVEDFGEIFNGGGDSRRSSSIPVLDVPALRERKLSFDARRSRLEYTNIFGGSGGSDGVASYEDLPAESRKMRNFTREERTRVGTRSPSEVSFSGSEDSQVLPHLSDKAKKFNLSYNRSSLGSKDGTNGTTHVTQLHDVPGFARVINGIDAASARDDDEKAKSPVFGSTPPEKSHKNIDQNVSPLNGYSTPSRFFTNNFNSKDGEASPSKVSVSDGGEGNFDFSPSYFDEELDANSAAAASAAAVRNAIDQAQEKIKIAKEIMERRKDMFQGNSYFNGSGAGKRKEAKKAKKVIKFSEMEENAEPNRFATSHLMNVEDISGQTLEFRCEETRAQQFIRERASMDGDEENEVRTLEKKMEISEKKSDDYETQKTVIAELSFEASIESENLSILENSNLPANIVGHECDVYGDDHDSAEQLHYLEENKEEFEDECEEQSEEKFEVDNHRRQYEEELQELRDSEVEKKLEDQSMDCVWEEIVKKPEESNKEEEEVFRGWMGSGKNFESDEKEAVGFHLGDKSKEINADAEELLEKSDCLRVGEEEKECREEDDYTEDMFDQQMEGEEIQTKVDLQTESKSQEIQVPSNVDKSDNELESSVESNENVTVDNSDDLEEESSSEKACRLGTFSLSWGSLNVSELTGLNDEKSGTVPVGGYEDIREEESSSSSSSSSSGKGEAEAFINQEDEFSENDDSLIDGEVNVEEADWQSNMFEKEETIEVKSNQTSDQEDEKSDSFLEPQIDSIIKKTEEKPEECLEKTEEDREKEKDSERKREQEKERIAVDRAIREARERAFADARERAERAAVEKATEEARQRMAAHAREKMAKTEAAAAVNERRSSDEARLRAQRAAVERATAEARERALEKALFEKLSGIGIHSKVRHRSMKEPQQKSSSSSSNSRNSSSSSNGAPQSGERSGGANDESVQRSKARLERHQKTAERAAKALAEKNMRDLLAQREQAEKNRLAEALDADIKRWSNGKHGNLRALLSTLQYILGAESGWQAVTLTEIVTSAAVKKAYRKATLCVHPDKLQQRGASLQQKYICEKVFDLLKEAWNRFRAEEK